MNGLWVKSQDGRTLLLAQEFEVSESDTGKGYIFANCKVVATYETEIRALEVLNDIEAQLIKGSSYDDMYGSRRVEKCNIYRMPKK